jgi:hypothetical protein
MNLMSMKLNLMCMKPSHSKTCSRTIYAYVSIRQHTAAYVSIRQHTSAYVSIRQHTSKTCNRRHRAPPPPSPERDTPPPLPPCSSTLLPPPSPERDTPPTRWSKDGIDRHTWPPPVYVSIRQHTGSIRQHTLL